MRARFLPLLFLSGMMLGVTYTGVSAGENLFPDPSFEKDGAAGLARTGQRAGHLRVGPKTHWGAVRGELKVTPFATYRATGYVRARVSSPGMMALYCYGWNSFDWQWVSYVPVQSSDRWQEVQTTFIAAADTVWFHPLAFIDAENSEAWIDDVTVEAVRSPEETIAALLAKDRLGQADRQLLARYYVHVGKPDRAWGIALGGDAKTRADVACLLGLGAADPDTRLKWTIEMVANGGLSYHNADKRFAELTAGIDLRRLLNTVVAELREQPGSVATAKAFVWLAERYLHTSSPLDTSEEVRLRLNAVSAALSQVREVVPAGTPARREVEKIMTPFTRAREAAAHRQTALGRCRIFITGAPVTADTYAIVLPTNATAPELHAARDLRKHLELLTGQTLPLLRDNAPGSATPIVVGRSRLLEELGVAVDFTALGPDGIVIRTVGHALVLTGNQRGVLYAVYTFLEDYLGCRWFTPDCTVLPQTGTFNIGPLDRTYVPPLEYRATDYPNSRDADWAVRNKLNGTQTRIDAERGGKISYSHFVHTFNQLLPPDQYFDEHPEYFSEVNGKRIKDHTQLCLTNPRVVELAIRKVKQWIHDAPAATIFSVSQNDWGNYCQCPNCRAVIEREGSPSGPLIEFVNKIADAVKEEYPHVLIDTLAYQYTRKPPKHVRPRPNVCVRLCSIECCFAHPLETDPYNASFVRDIQEWAKRCNRLYIWDYVINYAHSLQPFPNLFVIQPNIDFFTRNHVKGVYEEANYFSKGGELAELRTYLMAKCLWDPKYDTNKALNEFLAGYYGPAARPLRQYLDLIHAPTKNPDMHLRIYSPPSAGNLTPELIAKAVKLFDEAERRVAGDPVVLHRVRVARLPIMYAQVMLAKGSYRLEGEKLVVSTPAGPDVHGLLDRFEKIARTEGVTRISERRDGTLDNWLRSSRQSFRDLPLVSLDNGALEVTVIPALGGRIWRMRYLKGHVAGARYVDKDVDLLKRYGRTGAFTPLTGGYEEFSQRQYRSPGWNEPYAVVSKDPTSIQLRATLRNGLQLTRWIRLVGDKPLVEITSTLTNISNGDRNACLRVHPAFLVGSLAQASVRLRTAADEETRLSLFDPGNPQGEHERYFRGADMPAGEWAVVDESKGLAVVNGFDPKQLDLCYLNWNGAEHRVNLELWSKQVDLKPGESLTVSHRYQVKVVGGLESKPLPPLTSNTEPLPKTLTTTNADRPLSPGEPLTPGRATTRVTGFPVRAFLDRVVNPLPLSDVGTGEK